MCHEDRFEQFERGKHAWAWAAMKATPTTHWQPMELIDGMKCCGGCHKIGIKSPKEIRQLEEEGSGFGFASCDACQTRHLFSVEEARQPDACRTCHMGFDHPQWEMYSSSKHGVRQSLKKTGHVPQEAAAPACQTCHMQAGDHELRTAWGFLAGRLPMPEDQQWAADRATILQALGVLDPEGQPTGRLEAVKTADRLTAEATREVAAFYRDGVLAKPESYAYPFPDLLTFRDAPTPVEQRLFVMFLKHRMQGFQGTFHANPDYALWYGWSELQRDLAEIRTRAGELRERHDGTSGEFD